MMNKRKTLAFGLLGSIGIAMMAASISLPAYASSKLHAPRQEKEEREEAPKKQAKMPAPMAKISPVQAMKLAVAKTGGKATQAIFEFDEGHWVYGVITVKNHKLMETEIDPVSGKVTDTEAVTPEGEAKEVKAEFTKMMQSG